tara:strand:- start:214 stop:684 length:471 start_codon:yes stop_codon:yes gene_type:complete
MSKLKKRLKKAVMIGAAAYGASKLKGAMDRKAMLAGADANEGFGQIAKKFVTKGPRVDKGKVMEGITKLNRSDLPTKRNMKSIFVGNDGTITKGLEKFKNKDIYSKTMKARRGEKSGGGLKNFLNKAILGPKAQLNMGGEASVKTKLNGTLKTKTY